MNKKILAIIFAVLAALLYAINIPFSKLLLNKISPKILQDFIFLQHYNYNGYRYNCQETKDLSNLIFCEKIKAAV